MVSFGDSKRLPVKLHESSLDEEKLNPPLVRQKIYRLLEPVFYLLEFLFLSQSVMSTLSIS